MMKTLKKRNKKWEQVYLVVYPSHLVSSYNWSAAQHTITILNSELYHKRRVFYSHWLTLQMTGGLPWRKIAFLAPVCDPIHPQKFDFWRLKISQKRFL